MGSSRSWVPFVLTVLCVAAEMITAGTPIDAAARPALITVIFGLAAIAVGASLFWSMGLVDEALGLRMVVALPILLSVLLVVTLILEANVHRDTARLSTAPVALVPRR
jgi:hypothetical protein